MNNVLFRGKPGDWFEDDINWLIIILCMEV